MRNVECGMWNARFAMTVLALALLALALLALAFGCAGAGGSSDDDDAASNPDDDADDDAQKDDDDAAAGDDDDGQTECWAVWAECEYENPIALGHQWSECGAETYLWPDRQVWAACAYGKSLEAAQATLDCAGAGGCDSGWKWDVWSCLVEYYGALLACAENAADDPDSTAMHECTDAVNGDYLSGNVCFFL